MNQDQVKGVVKQAVGKVQTETGKLTGDVSQQAKGVGKQVEGKAQKTVGDVSEVANHNTKNR